MMNVSVFLRLQNSKEFTQFVHANTCLKLYAPFIPRTLIIRIGGRTRRYRIIRTKIIGPLYRFMGFCRHKLISHPIDLFALFIVRQGESFVFNDDIIGGNGRKFPNGGLWLVAGQQHLYRNKTILLKGRGFFL